MDYNIKILNKEEYVIWDELVDKSGFGTVFNKSSWTGAIQKSTKGIYNEIVGLFDKENNLEGGINLCYVKVLKNLSFLIIPPYTPYNGFVINERETKSSSKMTHKVHEISLELIKYLEKRFHSISISFNPYFTDIRSFTWRKYRSEVRYTYRTDIAELDNSFKHIDYSIRKQINKAKKQDFKIIDGSSNSDIEELLRLEEMSFNRQGFTSPFHKTDSGLLIQSIVNDLDVSIYTMLLDELPVASRMEIIDNETIYDWRAGADPEYFNTGGNQLLLWRVMEEMNKKGLKQFDFGGANIKTIANYKAAYNFSLVPYYNISKITSKPVGLLINFYNFIKKV